MHDVGEVEYSSDYAIKNDKYGVVSVTVITYHVTVDIYKIWMILFIWILLRSTWRDVWLSTNILMKITSRKVEFYLLVPSNL